jgi:hypothetical protein
MDTELFALVCHLMKHAANGQLRHMPYTLLHIYLQVWAIQTAKTYVTDLTLTIHIAEKCTRTLTVTHIEIFHLQSTVKSATKYYTLCPYEPPVTRGWTHISSIIVCVMMLLCTHTAITDNATCVCTEPVTDVIRLRCRPLFQHLRRLIQGLGMYLIKTMQRKATWSKVILAQCQEDIWGDEGIGPPQH